MDELPSNSAYPSASLARRTIRSLTWNAIANLLTLPVSFLQSILVARLLPVEAFGVFGGVAAFTTLCYAFFEFGLGAAALHRAPETEDEERTIAILFTLRLISLSIGAAFLVIISLAFLSDLRRQVLIVLALSAWALHVTTVGQILLIRRVEHRRLAVMDIVQTVLVFILVVWVATATRSIWTLTVAPIVQALVYSVALYVWRPIWKPRLAWERSAVRYFLRFGWRTVTGTTLGVALDQVDDLWTNVYLGDLKLGFYSRAYRFAIYPRTFLSEPVNTLSLGIYAELKHDRQRRSKAFFQVNALLVRSGFMLAGWLALIAPHFIRIFLGERWLPMLAAFQLMLVYTMFDPMKLTIANLLIAVGEPEKVSQTRLIQLLTLIAGLYLLGPRWGIAGVALAVDSMLVIGIGLLLWRARAHVDVSLPRLFVVPTVALILGIAGATLTGRMMPASASDWQFLFAKSLTFILIYGGFLFALEKRPLQEAVQSVFTISRTS